MLMAQNWTEEEMARDPGQGLAPGSPHGKLWSGGGPSALS